MHNYHDVFNTFPPGSVEHIRPTNVVRRYSFMLQILPYIDQAPLYNSLSGIAAPAGPGLADPWSRQAYWTLDIPGLICPSDIAPDNRNESPTLISYKVSVGDYLVNQPGTGGPHNNSNPTRGMFSFRSKTGVRDCLDGTSNTILMAELVMGTSDFGAVLGGVAINVTGNTPQDCLNRIDPADSSRLTGCPANCRTDFRPPGGRAFDGRTYFAFMATAVRPNGPHCQSSNVDGNWGHATASSRHEGGVHALLSDGAVRFISENIDAGNPAAASPTSGSNARSPYGVWGALGSRAGGEPVGEF
jgi:hypothetical protein